MPIADIRRIYAVLCGDGRIMLLQFTSNTRCVRVYGTNYRFCSAIISISYKVKASLAWPFSRSIQCVIRTFVS